LSFWLTCEYLRAVLREELRVRVERRFVEVDEAFGQAVLPETLGLLLRLARVRLDDFVEAAQQ